MNLLLADDDALRAGATDRYSYFLRITATGGKKRCLEGMEAGADDSMTKPVDYVEDRSEAQFSHGYCPECYEKHVRPQIEKP